LTFPVYGSSELLSCHCGMHGHRNERHVKEENGKPDTTAQECAQETQQNTWLQASADQRYSCRHSWRRRQHHDISCRCGSCIFLTVNNGRQCNKSAGSVTHSTANDDRCNACGLQESARSTYGRCNVKHAH